MNDPHVEELIFRFVSENPDVTYHTATDYVEEFNEFTLKLSKDILYVKPKIHFSDADALINLIRPILKSWESHSFLTSRKFRIRFIYKEAKIIDRNPEPTKHILHIDNASHLILSGEVSLVLNKASYPPIPSDFLTSTLIDELILRLQDYKDGKDKLPVIAYVILDRLENEYSEKGKRDLLAKKIKISSAVLDKLGRLSNKKNIKIGRHAGTKDEPISTLELDWMEQVVFRLVQRIGEINFAGLDHLPKITMEDFPKID